MIKHILNINGKLMSRLGVVQQCVCWCACFEIGQGGDRFHPGLEVPKPKLQSFEESA